MFGLLVISRTKLMSLKYTATNVRDYVDKPFEFLYSLTVSQTQDINEKQFLTHFRELVKGLFCKQSK